MVGSRRARSPGRHRGRERTPDGAEAGDDSAAGGSDGGPPDGRPRGTAKDRALLLLGVRWRSREELRVRLTRVGFDADEIQRALTDLEAVGLIDDQRFADEFVKDRAGRRLAGDRVIRQELRLKGVDGEDVQRALDGAGDERARAVELAGRQALRFAALPLEAAHRRILGMLMRRGYAPGLAREVTREALAGGLDGSQADLDDA